MRGLKEEARHFSNYYCSKHNRLRYSSKISEGELALDTEGPCSPSCCGLLQHSYGWYGCARSEGCCVCDADERRGLVLENFLLHGGCKIPTKTVKRKKKTTIV